MAPSSSKESSPVVTVRVLGSSENRSKERRLPRSKRLLPKCVDGDENPQQIDGPLRPREDLRALAAAEARHAGCIAAELTQRAARARLARPTRGTPERRNPLGGTDLDRQSDANLRCRLQPLIAAARQTQGAQAE